MCKLKEIPGAQTGPLDSHGILRLAPTMGVTSIGQSRYMPQISWYVPKVQRHKKKRKRKKNMNGRKSLGPRSNGKQREM